MRLVAILFLLICTQVQAMDLWLQQTKKVTGPFIRLSDLIVDKQHKHRFNSVFLGENKGKRKIPLDYIKMRLNKAGFFTVYPKLKEDIGHVYVIDSRESLATIKAPAIKTFSSKTLEKVKSDRVLSSQKEYVLFARRLGRGQVVRKSDLKIEEQNKIVHNAVYKLEDVVGKRLLKSVNKGAIVLDTHLEIPPVVSRGDVVKMIYKNQSIQITGIGRATESGVVGDTIQIKRNRDMVLCKVVGKNLVEVVVNI